ncbi:MAG: hypothetical protein ACXADH_18160 [Candidatus Kariarchaeaceae archaeon]|jgi:hypothetical protein
MSGSEADPTNESGECIWKPPIKKKTGEKVQLIKFPCRYPDKPKSAEICNPCLLGDIFAMSFTQMTSVKAQQGMNEEIMTYLRNLTSDDELGDFR